jgi:hypothetical protein
VSSGTYFLGDIAPQRRFRGLLRSPNYQLVTRLELTSPAVEVENNLSIAHLAQAAASEASCPCYHAILKKKNMAIMQPLFPAAGCCARTFRYVVNLHPNSYPTYWEAIDAKTRCQVYPTPDIDVQYVRTLNHGGKSQMLDLSESRER